LSGRFAAGRQRPAGFAKKNTIPAHSFPNLASLHAR